MSARMEPPHTVGGAIARRARRSPDKPALVGIDEPCVSFGELAAAMSAAREALAAAGLQRTDRVGVLAQPGVAGAQLLVSLACNIAAVPIDPALPSADIEQLIDATGIRALARLGRHGALELERLAPPQERAAAMRPTTSTDVALLLDAAGSPGRGLRIAVRHRDLRALAAEMGAPRWLDLGKSDRAACLVPLHSTGIDAALFAPLVLGASVAFAPAESLGLLQPTFLCVTRQSLDRLLQNLRADARPTAPSLRFVLCASGELAEAERLAAQSTLRAPLHEIIAKPVRHETTRQASDNAPAAELPGLGPSDDLLELEVRHIWRRLLQRDDIGLDEHFFVAGGDSLLATQMLLEVEALTGRAYPQSDLSALTIRHIAQALKDGMPEERGCITRARAGSRIPLFFCHGDFQARGLYAHQLAALLPEGQPVYLLHPEREPPAGTTAEELACRYLDEVLRVAAGSRVLLGGYCNGGYVAWHLAHLLRARGVDVAALLLVETPSFNARPIVRRLAQLLRVASAALPGRGGWRAHEQAMRAVWSLYRHGVAEFTRRLYRTVRGRLKPRSAPASVPSWWLFVRAMATRYVPPPLDVDVYCILADEGPHLDTDSACWEPLVSSVTSIGVPGTHLSAVISHRRALGAAFARTIHEVTERRAASRPHVEQGSDMWKRLRTIRRMARMLKERALDGYGCITQARAGSGIPLFFCHGDFVAQGAYAHQLAARLPEEQPVYLLHPEREPPAGTSAEQLAGRYLEEVLRAAPGSPVILGGYCNGGYIAWHLAHLLRARGVEVVALFLVETPSFNARPIVRKVARWLAGWPVQEPVMRAVWSLCRHGPAEFFRRLWEAAAERLRARPAPGAAASWWLFVRSMATRYVPPPIDVDVYCFLAEEDPGVETEPGLWRPLASSVSEITVPGTHRSAVFSHHRTLAAVFERAIYEAMARRGVSVARPAPQRSPCRAAPAGQAG
jgi:thioesterase domain-containing protein